MEAYDARVIITSCNEYSELLRTLLYSYEKHWPDRKWPLTFALDQLPDDIKTGNKIDLFTFNDDHWSNILLNCLKNYNEEVILLALDDFILRSKVNNELLNSLVLNMKNNNSIKYLRLVARPKTFNKSMAVFEELKKNEPYRVSLQASLWQRDFLIKFLKSNESPWEFEINGTQRSRIYNGFYSASLDLFPYKHHVIQRGKWFPWSFLKLKLNGYPISIKKRKIMNLFESIFWIVHKILSKIKSFIKK